MTTSARTILLFDNSALNHLFGQSTSIDDDMRKAVIARMRTSDPGSYSVAINAGLAGELSGLFFSNRSRFDRVARFLFETCDWHVLRPALDDQGKPLRFEMEVQHGGKVPWDSVMHTRREMKWLGPAFVDGKRSILDRLAADAQARKKKYAVGERQRRADAQNDLEQKGQAWDAEFRGWESDPWTVVDEWTRFAMDRLPRFYGLPADSSRWPKPRDFVTLWYARAYHVARLRQVFGEKRRCDDGSDLYDGMYFDDAAYADIFVTGDRKLIERVQPLRLSTPRVLTTEAWVAEFIGQAPSATA